MSRDITPAKLAPTEPTLRNEILQFATQTGCEAASFLGRIELESHFFVVHEDSQKQVLADDH